MVWMIVAFMLLLSTFRGSVPLVGTFFFLFLMYLLIGAAQFTGRGKSPHMSSHDHALTFVTCFQSAFSEREESSVALRLCLRSTLALLDSTTATPPTTMCRLSACRGVVTVKRLRLMRVTECLHELRCDLF